MMSACGSPLEPFNPALVNQVKDAAAPVIEIASPVSDSVYSQTVTVSGTVTDDGAVLPELTYTVSDSLGSQEKAGSIELTQLETDDGINSSFSFTFTTSEYSSDILLEINGTDWNGNVSEPTRLRLIFSGNTIPSFSTAAASTTISCSWAGVEGASSYRIYYTTDGSIPYENYGESTPLLTSPGTESSPYVISGLSNGSPHVVRLMAYSDNGESWSSELKTVVPLSQLSLRPKVYSNYGELSLEWFHTSDFYGYEVYRGEGSDGIPINISGTITENAFTDTRVEDDVDYFYYVKPSIAGAVMSAGSAGRSFPLTSGVDRTLGSLIDLSSIYYSTVSGDKAFLINYTGDLHIVDISDPENPVQIGYWDNPNTSYDSGSKVVISGDHAYMSKYTKIYCIDISNPAVPVLDYTIQPDETTVTHNACIYDIHIRGSKLFAVATLDSTTSDREGRYCYEIESDGRLTEDWFFANVYQRIAEVDADPAGSGDLLVSYRNGASDPSGIFRLTASGTQTDFIAEQTTSMYYGAVIDEDRDLAICIKKNNSSGVFSFEFRKLSDGTLAGTEYEFEDSGFVGGYLDGNIFYIVQSYSMLALKLSGTTGSYTASELYQVSLPGNARGISPYNNYTVCGVANGLQIINSEQKQASSILYYSAHSARSVDVSGDTVYVGEGNASGSLAVYSFAEKGNPVLLGRSSGFTPIVYDLLAAGDYVFLAATLSGQPGIYVVDVSNPALPVSIGSFDTEIFPDGMDLLGDYLAVFCNGFVEILNVSDPSSILRVSRTRTTTNRYGDVAFKSGYLFNGYENSAPAGGLAVYDISNPAVPEVKHELTTYQIEELAVSGEKLYGYSDQAELTVYDISDPENTTFLQEIIFTTSGAETPFPSGIDAIGDYVFLHGWTDGDGDVVDDGLQIYNTENTAVVDQLEFNDLGNLCDDEGKIKIYGRYLYIASGELMCIDIAP
jgi:hypothetical protein